MGVSPMFDPAPRRGLLLTTLLLLGKFCCRLRLLAAAAAHADQPVKEPKAPELPLVKARSTNCGLSVPVAGDRADAG